MFYAIIVKILILISKKTTCENTPQVVLYYFTNMNIIPYDRLPYLSQERVTVFVTVSIGTIR